MKRGVGWPALAIAMAASACAHKARDSGGAPAASVASAATAPTPSSAASASMAVWGRAFPPQTPEQETQAIARLWVGHLPRLSQFAPQEDICGAFETSSARQQPAKDAWGTPFDVRCDPPSRYVLRSAGADRQFGTADDVLTTKRPSMDGFATPRPPLEPPRGRGPRPILQNRE